MFKMNVSLMAGLFLITSVMIGSHWFQGIRQRVEREAHAYCLSVLSEAFLCFKEFLECRVLALGEGSQGIHVQNWKMYPKHQ